MLQLSGRSLTLEDIDAVAAGRDAARLDPAIEDRLDAARRLIDDLLAAGRVAYGINTGFGRLATVRVPPADLSALQLNLVRSHACGLGPPLSEAETRAMMLLRANTLALGRSGVRVVLIRHLLSMLEHGIHPVVPEKGSVGASGDLAPLAHLALAVIGEGDVEYRGERMAAVEAFRRSGLDALPLEAKEGLALLNGTQGMAAVGALALRRAERVVGLADLAGAMSLEALRGTPVAFDARIHAARPHTGQRASAARLRRLLADSEIRQSHLDNDPRVQDAYSLRCMPQVHGAVRDALTHVRAIVETESGSATDNPLIFAEDGEILSGGNFHGAPLALGFDYAAIAMTDLTGICERRIERLVNPDLNEGLPTFLTRQPGLSSGFMMAQVAAAAVLAESRVLAHPASVDNTPTSGGQEDHVSMGMTAAVKLRQIVDNAERVVAIELMAAAEGLEHRAPLTPAREVQKARDLVRVHVGRLVADRSLAPDIERLAAAIRAGTFDAWAFAR